MEDFDSIILPPHGNPIVIQWLKQGKLKIMPSGCWEWQRGTSKSGFKEGRGYGTVRFDGKSCLAHRVAINAPIGMCALHSCDYPTCVNPWHLRIGTQSENVEDMRLRGRKLIGSSINKKCISCNRISQNDMETCSRCQSEKLVRFCSCGKIAGVTTSHCGSCYMKLWRSGDLPVKVKKICHCGEIATCKSMCRKHYNQSYHTHNPKKPKRK